MHISRRAAGSLALFALFSVAACNKPSDGGSSSAPSAAATSPSAATPALRAATPTESDALVAYRADLVAQRRPTDDLHEAPELRIGAWHLFFRGSPARAVDAAAVSDGGDVVSLAHRDRWHALLAEPATPQKLAAAFALLLGNPSVLESGAAIADPAVQALIVPPVFERDSVDALTLTMWVVRPPDTQSPSRLRVGAPRNGRGWFDDAGYRNVMGSR